MKKLTVLLFALLYAYNAIAESIELTTPQGVLVGDKEGAIASFKSIPFATPPVGTRRWKAPETAPNWTGKRTATEFSPACAQVPYAQGSMFSRPHFPSSEDCLYLNVWTPQLQGDKPLPVMVWIHGGALTRGSGASNIYEGTKLAQKGVVVVTINYRLGAFGYMAHPELSSESVNGSSGNYGTLDQIAALEWVQNNISAFGGDSKNVTIFGESAGSWSVNHLTASPLAAGLFHKAIGQSGAKFDPMPLLNKVANNVASAESVGLQFSKYLGAKSIQQLRDLTAENILAGFDSFQARGFSQPNVDGYVFPDHIANIYKSGMQNKVSLILGSNADEGKNLIPPPTDKAKSLQYFKFTGGEHSDELLNAYNFEQNPVAASYGVFRDMVFTWNMSEWASLAAKSKQDTWLYYFSFAPPSPMNGRLGAYHAAEIRYAFNNEHVMFGEGSPNKEEEKLGKQMSDYWVNFAKTGAPSSKGHLQWTKYSAETKNYMRFDKELKLEQDLLSKELNVVGKVQAAAWK
ncbi:MAG: para-nitrobenzyl esterase [Gammaproteobacteria bacterium]|jgi:para-nitrobenzyl esterase